MPQQQWSDKRERQYEDIRQSARDRGESEERAKEIAARTVNKEVAQAGESEQASRTSVEDVWAGHRGGKRGVKGRSKMSKRELQHALGR
ncbi:MAG TPA: plasmid stabilization protein [Nocardioidaceae bacterium]|nr:plasmid stabilization protein [Nocardioidaceae bacterium]